VQSYGPDVQPNLQLGATATSREWYRPNPPLPSIKWGPRNNTNIQESALLLALHQVAGNRELYLENYYAKNRRAIEFGRTGEDATHKPVPNAWVVPALQRRKADAADLVNELRKQGAEIQRASAAFKIGNIEVAAGDYVVRADQPYRTLADMYFAVQNYPTANPRPYDDTDWTMQYLRDVTVRPVHDKSILDQPMTLLTADAKAPGGVEGSGSTLVVEHTGDNNLVAFRYKNLDVRMLVAEDDFELNGRKLRAGALIIPDADRARLEPMLRDLGLSAWAVSSAPAVKTHEMKLPRIGSVHSWSRTQDEGWVRAALDHYGIPYTYFADQKLREGNLRARYDVIIFPHVGGTAQSMLAGIPKTPGLPIPYRKTAATPNLGGIDESDDIRGGMGMEGLQELARFVEEGGTLITEGSTASMMAEYDLSGGVTVEHPQNLFVRGSILRARIADPKSPIAYGYDNSKDLPVYFNQDPVFNVPTDAGGSGAAFGFGGGGRGGAPTGPINGGAGQNVTPMAVPIHVSPLDPADAPAQEQPAASGRGGRGGRGGADGAGGRGAVAASEDRSRVVIQFASNANDLLLSGTLAGGDALANRAAAVDVPLGKGHMVLFALRPFWRWQTQGTYFLGFNAILNWDHLDAGKSIAPPAGRGRGSAGQ
jgi:hypothetical protein